MFTIKKMKTRGHGGALIQICDLRMVIGEDDDAVTLEKGDYCYITTGGSIVKLDKETVDILFETPKKRRTRKPKDEPEEEPEPNAAPAAGKKKKASKKKAKVKVRKGATQGDSPI